MAAKGKTKADHTVVYSGRAEPSPTDAEKPRWDEKGLLHPAIRVDADNRGEKLDAMSRLNLGAMYTIDHSVKVRSFGKVNPSSERVLKAHLNAVGGNTFGSPQALPSKPSQHQRLNSGGDTASVDSHTAVECWTRAHRFLREKAQMSEEQIRSAVDYANSHFACPSKDPPASSSGNGKARADDLALRPGAGISPTSADPT